MAIFAVLMHFWLNVQLFL